MKRLTTLSCLTILGLSLGACGRSQPHSADTPAGAGGPQTGTAVRASAAALNRLLTRTGPDGRVTPLAVGPADGSIQLTVGVFAAASDGTYVAHSKRHDEHSSVHDYQFDAVLTEDASGQVALSIRYPDGKPSYSYALKLLGETSVTWKTTDALPWNNDATGGTWLVEFDQTSVRLDADGRTVYTIGATEYPLDAAYVTAHDREVADSVGRRRLVDATSGQALVYQSADGPQAAGIFGQPVIKTLTWGQLAP